MPTPPGCHVDDTALPLRLLVHHTEPSHCLTRCEGEQITPASRRDSWREEEEEEKRTVGKWRTEQIEIKGILFHFDCQQRGDSFFSFPLPLSTALAWGP